MFNSSHFFSFFHSGEEYGEEEQFDDDEEIEGKLNESEKFQSISNHLLFTPRQKKLKTINRMFHFAACFHHF